MVNLVLPADQALILLAVALPFCVWAGLSDLRSMKIPNYSVYGLALGFVLAGVFLMPFTDYLWRLAALPVVLVAGMVLNAVRLIGAGDAKFVAAASPYVMVADAGAVLMLYLALLVITAILHRAAKASPLRRLAPDWQSWTSGKRFPMGVTLGLTLALYLALPLFGI